MIPRYTQANLQSIVFLLCFSIPSFIGSLICIVPWFPTYDKEGVISVEHNRRGTAAPEPSRDKNIYATKCLEQYPDFIFVDTGESLPLLSLLDTRVYQAPLQSGFPVYWFPINLMPCHLRSLYDTAITSHNSIMMADHNMHTPSQSTLFLAEEKTPTANA